jgi:hydrogenase maturation protease
MGNPWRRDDGVGAAVLRALRGADPGPGPAVDSTVDPAVDLLDLDGEPARMVEAWDGREVTVVVDAVVDPARRPGEVVLLDGGAREAASRPAVVSGHSAGLEDAIRLGRALGRMPRRLAVVGVVAADLGQGPGLSPEVAAAVDEAAAAARALAVAGAPVTEVADVPC